MAESLAKSTSESAGPEPGADFRRRRWPRAATLTLVLLALAATERGARWLRYRFLLPTQGAVWIWAEGVSQGRAGVAFVAAADFDLELTPETARLLIQADEEYVAFLNGRRVGSGRYASGAPLAAYDVTPLLIPGANRLAVELRSARGAGGVLAALVPGAGEGPEELRHPRAWLRSGRSWRIFAEGSLGVVEGWRPLSDGSAPQLWQGPPTGRWRIDGEALARPRFDQIVVPGPPGTVAGVLRPQSEGEGAEGPSAGGVEGAAGEPGILIDLGRSYVGYLELSVDASSKGRLGLATASTLSALAEARRVPVLRPAGAALWRDAQARRLRYAWVSGEAEVQAARLRVVAAPWREQELERRSGEGGLFGIEPPPRKPQKPTIGSKSTTFSSLPSVKR